MVDYHIDNFITLGVDFVFLDFTNGTQRHILDGAHSLCRRLVERREGPKVAFWIRSVRDVGLFRTQFYERYPDAMFRLDGGWLLLVHGVADGWKPRPGVVKPVPKVPGFTVRWCWGLLGAASGTMWSFKETQLPKVSVGREQIPVAFASQATYMTTPTGRRCRGSGLFDAQAAHARTQRPRIVTLTGYNEWMAVNLGGTDRPVFTDLASPDCSHDIEPMRGGHGRVYFDRAASFVKSLK